MQNPANARPPDLRREHPLASPHPYSTHLHVIVLGPSIPSLTGPACDLSAQANGSFVEATGKVVARSYGSSGRTAILQAPRPGKKARSTSTRHRSPPHVKKLITPPSHDRRLKKANPDAVGEPHDRHLQRSRIDPILPEAAAWQIAVAKPPHDADAVKAIVDANVAGPNWFLGEPHVNVLALNRHWTRRNNARCL